MTQVANIPADSELLSSYVATGSEGAFAELVHRHLNLVHSAALRQVQGDAAAAADVAQTVFIELARQASGLTRHPALIGWLYTTTHRMAARHLRDGIRRQCRERDAHAMREIQQLSESEIDWSRLAPVLDRVMHELAEADRLALLLRYFEKRPFVEVGARLGLNENAARMRVDRALDRLRGHLADRGITSTASALALVLSGPTMVAAPAGLAATVCQASAFSLTTHVTTIKAIAMTKAQFGILATALAAAVSLNVAQFAINRDLRSKLDRPASDLQSELARPAPQPAARPAPGSETSESRPPDQTELLRLRGKISQLRNQLNDVSVTKSAAENAANLWKRLGGKPFSVEASPGAPFVPNSYYPRDQWTAVGLNTHEATLQTAFAAMKSGDTDLLAGAIDWKSSLTEAQKQEAIARLKSNGTGSYPGAGAVGIKIESLGGTLDSANVEYVVILDQGTDLPSLRAHYYLNRVEDGWRLGNVIVEPPSEP
jgi:RNA polymerase sigma factor (sigma-70 family)